MICHLDLIYPGPANSCLLASERRYIYGNLFTEENLASKKRHIGNESAPSLKKYKDVNGTPRQSPRFYF